MAHDYKRINKAHTEEEFWPAVALIASSIGIIPYLRTSHRGRFLLIRVNLQAGTARINYVLRAEKVKFAEFKLRNLRLDYRQNGHHEIHHGNLLNTHGYEVQKTTIFDIYKLTAFDDSGEGVELRPGVNEFRELLRGEKQGLEFEYLKFLIDNSERFGDENASIDVE